MKPSIGLKQRQKLKLSPQLQKTIRLLQLSSPELEIEVQAMLEANPLLEIDHGDDLKPSLQNMETEVDVDPSQFDSTCDSSQTESSQIESLQRELSEIDPSQIDPNNSDYTDYTNFRDYSEHPNHQDQTVLEMTLQQHLYWQIEISGLTTKERLIANVIIDAISDDGYLCCHLKEIQDTLEIQESGEFAMADIEEVLFKIQQFEPLGVASRDLQECLSIQLNHLPKETQMLSEAKALVKSYLPLLAKKNYKAICFGLQIPKSRLNGVVRLITKLDPKPGRQMSVIKNSDCIIPDLVLKKKNQNFVVELNMNAIPKLRINADYAMALKSVGTKPGPHGLVSHREDIFFKQHLQEAQWFLKGLQNRYSTLLKVATVIVKKQTAFLEQGEEFMQGLSLQDIADLTNLHESTISRATSGKYIETHRGIFELKHFFSHHIQSEDGVLHATAAIRAMIKKLIEEESPLTPLSDEQIRKILLARNRPLSRRTISKYREALHIQSSAKRYRDHFKIEM